MLILPLLIQAGAARAAEPASANPAGQANRQFVEAMRQIREAGSLYDPKEQARRLLEADRLLADIINRLPESPLAVQLVTNQFIGDFDYQDFKARIRGLACAQPESNACLLHRVEELMPPLEQPIAAPRWDWLSLAVAHYHLGDRDRVRPIISPFLEALRRGGLTTPPAGSSSQDMFLGRALVLTGELDLALSITRGIRDCSSRIYNLTDIVEALVWQKQMQKAAELAEEASDYARANGCAWELGLVAQALLRAGSEARARTLFLNTVEEQFSRFKDQRGTCCPPELAVAAGDMGDPNLALGLLRTVQDESPWTVPQVLGRLGRRGELLLALTYADQIADPEVRAETYVELTRAALTTNNKGQAESLLGKLDQIQVGRADPHPLVLVQKARAEKLLFGDERWRRTFVAALGEAETAGLSQMRRDLSVPFLAALVEIETGKPMLE